MKHQSLFFLAALSASVCAACGGDPAPLAATSTDAPVSDPVPAPVPVPGESAPPPAPTPKPALGAPYPIVLLHGMGGFDTLESGGISSTYFAGVVDDLTARGEKVFVTVAPPYASSETRAAAIAPQLDAILARTGAAKLNVIGHSQGGLDARVLASPAGLGYGDRIASVTTIATPHRGSTLSDATLRWFDWTPGTYAWGAVNAYVGLLQRSVYDVDADADLHAQVQMMSTAYMRDTFNPTFVDAPGVAYRSYAGRTNLRTGIYDCAGSTYPNDTTDLDVAQGNLGATALYLEEGLLLRVNDGLVTVESARWGTFDGCIPADHLKQIGHVGAAATFDHRAFFRDVVARLRSAGL